MGFEIIRAETRLENIRTFLMGVQNKITDWLPGAKTRTKLEAVCIEMEQQDFATEQLVRKAIPTSTYQTFNFPLNPAERAYGVVRFTASPTPSSAFVIPAGTTVSTTTSTPMTYETVTDATVSIGQTTVDVPVICTTAGSTGNTGALTVTSIKTPVSGIVSVTNINSILGGIPVESEADRRVRFNKYITTLARGTADSLKYGALTAALYDANGQKTEQVKSAKVTEPPATGSAGSCTIYIWNGATTASNDLIAKCQQIIDGYYDSYQNPVPGYKAAGVVVTVASASLLQQTCSMTISVLPGYDLTLTKTRAISAVNTYFQSLGVGDELVRNELIQRIMSIDGVYNLDMPFPDIDVPAASNEVVVLDTTTPLATSITTSTWTG